MKQYDILVPGNYFCDLIFSGLPKFPALGAEVFTDSLRVTVGGALNTVIALHRLGVNVGWLAQVGTDFFSRFVFDLVTQEGVDVSLVHTLETPMQRVTVSLSYPHERAFVTFEDSALTPTQMLQNELDAVSFRHLHFTGLECDPTILETLDAVRARGATISMDCQERSLTIDSPIVRETLQCLDFFMPNRVEAQRIARCDSLDAAVETLRPLVKTLVVKDGANGAYLRHAEKMLHAPALAVTPLDTTGAGDVFNAGFLAAYLQEKSLAECLRWGNVCGGLSTLDHGGAAAAPTRAQLEQILDAQAA